jgi:hypothetical protein
MQRIHGTQAIDYALETGRTLSKYADPTEGARYGLSISEAKAVAAQDPGLVYVDVGRTLDSMTDLQRDSLSQGYSAGNWANAYTSQDLKRAWIADFGSAEGPEDPTYRAAYILGFFSALELYEIPGSYREVYDSAYWSDAGQAVIEAGYTESRRAAYEAEVC